MNVPYLTLERFREAVGHQVDSEAYWVFVEFCRLAQVDTPERLAMAIAQLGHESASFRRMEEVASGEAYEGRAVLGNTTPGDGVRFKGRGLIQITGRDNYTRAAKATGLDLLKTPELAAGAEGAAKTAAWFWRANSLNVFADKRDMINATIQINGGLNGINDRKNRLARACTVLGIKGEWV